MNLTGLAPTCGSSSRQGGRVLIAWCGSLCLAAAVQAGESLEGIPSDTASPLPPDLTQMLWALLIPVGLILAGIFWLALVRHEARRQTGAISRRRASLEAWYQDLFENAHDILLSLDLDGRLTDLNRAGRSLLGVSIGAASHPSLTDLVVEADRDALRMMLQALAGGQQTAHGELVLSPTPEQRAVLRINLRRQALPGRPVEIRGVAWDVTAQHQAQEALRESEQRLRHSLEERIRIGRDLHDGIIQSIYAVGLSLGECRRWAEEDSAEARRRIEASVRDLNAVIREVRGFIEGLEPEALKGREFHTALESVAEGLGVPQHLTWALEVDPDAANQLTAQEAADLLQVARETLSNTLRHGGARRVAATLSQVEDGVALRVTDDGRGFDPTDLEGGGLGLRNIVARAEDLGGRVKIDSSPGQGTSITIILPSHGNTGSDSA